MSTIPTSAQRTRIHFNQAHVLRAQVGTADLHAGNDIGPLAYMTVPNAGPTGNATEYLQYSIMTIDPALDERDRLDRQPEPRRRGRIRKALCRGLCERSQRQ